jgi:hypothetical protein
MRIVILSSIISPLSSARWRSSPKRVRHAERPLAASRHISMALDRLTEVDGRMILVFERVVTKCRLAFAVCATLNSPTEVQRIESARSDPSTLGNAISRLCRSGR